MQSCYETDASNFTVNINNGFALTCIMNGGDITSYIKTEAHIRNTTYTFTRYFAYNLVNTFKTICLPITSKYNSPFRGVRCKKKQH
jgi:hypothetical protein